MKNIIIIGGGLMGNAVAWKLSSYGEKVELLEQQGKNGQHNSSYGEARIARSLGPQKDIFSFVHNRTVEEVDNLLRFLNGLSPSKKHKIKDIYHTSPVSYLYHKDHQAEIDKLKFKRQKDKYKKASGDAAFRKFGVTIPDDCILVREYKKHSGTFNPKVLIKKLQLGIQQKGNQIKYNRKVVSVVKKQGFFELKILNTKKNTTTIVQTKRVIVAVGAYIPILLKKIAPYFKKLITPKKVALSFFRINNKQFKRLSQLEKKNILKAHPMFDQNGKMFFSMIEKFNKQGFPIFKVGGHELRRNIIDLDKNWKTRPTNKEVKWAKKHFRKYLEMLEIHLRKKDIEHLYSSNCVYSVSNTKIPFVTHLIDKDGVIDKDIVVVGGMSGVGAKGALGYGTLAADLLLNISEPSRIYRKAVKEFGSPLLRLRTKKRKSYTLF